MTSRAIGDSFTYGYGATTNHDYLSVLSRLQSTTYTNLGVNGAQVADQIQNIWASNITALDTTILELGTNDHYVYGNDSTKRGYFRTGIQDAAAWLGLVDKQKGLNNTNTTGTWIPTTSFATGKMSQTAGSTITFTVSGTTVYFGSIEYSGNGSSYKISIDGMDMGTFLTNAPGINTQQGMPCGPRLHRFSGLSAGSHTVVFTALGGGYAYAEWCAGNDQVSFPKLYVMELTKLNTNGYANCPRPISDATLATYNDALISAMNELMADGLNIKLFDTNYQYYPDVDTYTDGVHPNDTGHCKIAMNLYKTMGTQ